MSISPVFIVGFPRSGTTALADAIGRLNGFSDFSDEGHFVYLFRHVVERVLDGKFHGSSFAKKEAARPIFAEEFAAFLDRFYRRTLGIPANVSWVDKTPDLEMMNSLPMLVSIFPNARFILIYRAPEKCVRSTLATWPNMDHDVKKIAERWSQCHTSWRWFKNQAPENCFEVFQPDMLKNDERLVKGLASFLGSGPEGEAIIADYLENNKQTNRPPPSEGVGQQYDGVTLTTEQLRDVKFATESEVLMWKRLAPSG